MALTDLEEGHLMPSATDVSPAWAIFDDDDVPAFLQEDPAWWKRGIYGFRLELDDPTAPTLWIFSRPAKRAFEAWQRTHRGTT
jgi:hypothetical protein